MLHRLLQLALEIGGGPDAPGADLARVPLPSCELARLERLTGPLCTLQAVHCLRQAAGR